MNRPLTRPLAPYTNAAILDMVRQHFVTDEAPACRSKSGLGGCVYGLTGCAVGCLLTQKDADTLDAYGYLSISVVREKFPEIYYSYFTINQLPLLRALQSAHDDSTLMNVKDRMAGAYSALAAIS